MSLVEQHTIDCEYLSYLLPISFLIQKKNYKVDIMQLFSADATMSLKKFEYLFCPQKQEKTIHKRCS